MSARQVQRQATDRLRQHFSQPAMAQAVAAADAYQDDDDGNERYELKQKRA